MAKYREAGISTDHEVSGYDEALEKISLGMKIQIREGSAAKNFETLMPLIPRYGESCMFCSDDIHPEDILDGHINRLVKRACDAGIDIMDALRCACLNPVVHYGLNTGLLRVGDCADFIEVDDLRSLNILRTYIRGNLVAENGLALVPHSPSLQVNNFRTEPKRVGDFVVRDTGRMVNIIEAVNNQITTGRTKALLRPVNGTLVSDTGQDILKLAVVNRYINRSPAVAFVRNFGLKSGAIASSIAHDSHNIIAVGVTDEEICGAVNAVIEHRGGLSVAYGGGSEVLPLPVAGLMTDGDGFRIAQEHARLNVLAKRLGSRLDAPFMTLSFMALLVIPDLKLSDKGLFDGIKFCLTDLFS